MEMVLYFSFSGYVTYESFENIPPGVTFITQIPVVRPIKTFYYPPTVHSRYLSRFQNIIRRRMLFFSSLIFRGEYH